MKQLYVDSSPISHVDTTFLGFVEKVKVWITYFRAIRWTPTPTLTHDWPEKKKKSMTLHWKKKKTQNQAKNHSLNTFYPTAVVLSNMNTQHTAGLEKTAKNFVRAMGYYEDFYQELWIFIQAQLCFQKHWFFISCSLFLLHWTKIKCFNISVRIGLQAI